MFGGTAPISDCVAGRAGGRVRCEIGSTLSNSTRPLSTKTLALGLATMTRAGGTITRPD